MPSFLEKNIYILLFFSQKISLYKVVDDYLNISQLVFKLLNFLRWSDTIGPAILYSESTYELQGRNLEVRFIVHVGLCAC